jgi:dTMP kinase
MTLNSQTAGKFITLEGIDGAGKSTHLNWLGQRIMQLGHEVVLTREPGGTALGEKLRSLLLAESMHAETEALLMFAARREHLEQVILPALRRGAWVVSDRFSDASFAYQCGGRGVAEEKIGTLESWVQGGLQPDLTLLFDVPVAEARQRVRRSTPDLDRFEQERFEFFQAVRDMYLKRAAEFPARIRILDSSQPVADVMLKLDQLVSELSC